MEDLETELSFYLSKKSSAAAWRTCRQIAGAGKGSKRRWGRCPILSKVSIDQVAEKYAKLPCDGGCDAVPTHTIPHKDEKAFVEDGYTALLTDFCKPDLEIPVRSTSVAARALSKEDMENMAKLVTSLPTRRAVPAWDCPVELLRLILRPQQTYGRISSGLLAPGEKYKDNNTTEDENTEGCPVFRPAAFDCDNTSGDENFPVSRPDASKAFENTLYSALPLDLLMASKHSEPTCRRKTMHTKLALLMPLPSSTLHM